MQYYPNMSYNPSSYPNPMSSTPSPYTALFPDNNSQANAPWNPAMYAAPYASPSWNISGAGGVGAYQPYDAAAQSLAGTVGIPSWATTPGASQANTMTDPSQYPWSGTMPGTMAGAGYTDPWNGVGYPSMSAANSGAMSTDPMSGMQPWAMPTTYDSSANAASQAWSALNNTAYYAAPQSYNSASTKPAYHVNKYLPSAITSTATAARPPVYTSVNNTGSAAASRTAVSDPFRQAESQTFFTPTYPYKASPTALPTSLSAETQAYTPAPRATGGCPCRNRK